MHKVSPIPISAEEKYLKKHKVQDIISDLVESVLKTQPDSFEKFCVEYFEDLINIKKNIINKNTKKEKILLVKEKKKEKEKKMEEEMIKPLIIEDQKENKIFQQTENENSQKIISNEKQVDMKMKIKSKNLKNENKPTVQEEEKEEDLSYINNNIPGLSKITEIENNVSENRRKVYTEVKHAGGRKSVLAQTQKDRSKDNNQTGKFCPPVYNKNENQKQSIKDSCKTLMVFSSLDDNDQKLFINALQPVTFQKGHAVMRQGEHNEIFYILFEGECDLYINEKLKRGKTGKDLGVRKKSYKAVNIFGGLALIHGAYLSSSIVVTSDIANVWTIDLTTFRKLMKFSETIKNNVFQEDEKSSVI